MLFRITFNTLFFMGIVAMANQPAHTQRGGVEPSGRQMTAQPAVPQVAPRVTQATPQVAQVSDAHGAEILKEIHEAEIDAGQIASRRAQNKEVKDFARKMVDAHKTGEKDTKKVAKDNKIDMDGSDKSEALEEEMEAAIKDLKDKKNGIEFDRAYVALQITMHEKAIEKLDNTLIPSASNAQYKAHLQKTRASVSEHLSHARQLQSRLQ